MKRDGAVHLELLEQRDDRHALLEEAARKLAPVPGQREALEAYRRRHGGPLRRLARALGLWR